MRVANITRKTKETDVEVKLELDVSREPEIDSGSGFFDHMLTLFASFAGISLKVKCSGDTWVDFHHSAEDIGIAMGEAFKEALGDKKGINRYGQSIMPMDEALVMVALDISGRAYLSYDVELRASRLNDDGALTAAKVGVFDTELVEEFFTAFTRSAGVTLHIKKICGKNTHHIIEAVFKGFGKALGEAIKIDPANAGAVPSTKGVL